MIYYHIDRTCSIQIGNLDFSRKSTPPFGASFSHLSRHGYNYFAGQSDSNNSREWEFALEYIRATKYPNLPSRFQCLFATSSEKDFRQWLHYFFQYPSPFHMVKIESDSGYEFDASFFTGAKLSDFPFTLQSHPTSLGAMCEVADHYWAGEKTAKPFLEVLIPLPCKVVEIEKFFINFDKSITLIH